MTGLKTKAEMLMEFVSTKKINAKVVNWSQHWRDLKPVKFASIEEGQTRFGLDNFLAEP